jgi:hypothetical protein
MTRNNPSVPSLLLLGALLLGGPRSALAAQPVPSAAPDLAATPMNQIVQSRVYPQLDYLFQKLSAEKDGVTVDGVAAFKSNDKFLPGKIAAGLGDVLLNTSRDDPRFAARLRSFREMVELTAPMDNHTWGIYYYMQTLYRLKKAGLLEQAVSPEALALLKRKLDWRHFVTQPGFELIKLPTNYYGVAFSIARLRMLLGWEDESGSKILLEKMLQHYDTYSGKYGFSDETAGEGRFDRYSILLVAEICERFIETGMTVTPELKAKLRKAADVALKLANTRGDGFSFGRSLGPYGETAMLEILSVSAYLDVLTPEEKQYAYSYATRIVAKYVEFWYDPALHSVDMWGKGRRTDTYRAKHRILGENFSLLHQLIFTNEFWNQAGLKDRLPAPGLQAWLDKSQPASSLTRFAEGEYDRALAVFRDRGHVFSLLMVNGGKGQHDNSPYYPLPFSNRIISGTPDSGAEHAQLLPKLVLADGTQLIGTAFLKDIQARRVGEQYHVRYRQDELDRLGQDGPAKDGRVKVETEYTLAPGTITRVDKFVPGQPLDVQRISLEFASFSDGAVASGNKIHFAMGDVTDFEVGGLADCKVEQTQGSEPFKAPDGPMLTHVSCATPPFTLKDPLSIKWVIKYR